MLECLSLAERSSLISEEFVVRNPFPRWERVCQESHYDMTSIASSRNTSGTTKR